MLKKGFTAPLLLVLVSSFLLVTAALWVFTNNVNTSSTSTNVKGASSNVPSYAKPGVAVYITSTQGTWDLVQYLCKDYDACITSLDAGKRWGTVGGGQSDLQETFVQYDPQWKDYKFLKLYVRPSWGSQSRLFDVVKLGDAPDTKLVTIKDVAGDYKVVVLPLDSIATKFYKSAEFANK